MDKGYSGCPFDGKIHGQRLKVNIKRNQRLSLSILYLLVNAGLYYDLTYNVGVGGEHLRKISGEGRHSRLEHML